MFALFANFWLKIDVCLSMLHSIQKIEYKFDDASQKAIYAQYRNFAGNVETSMNENWLIFQLQTFPFLFSARQKFFNKTAKVLFFYCFIFYTQNTFEADYQQDWVIASKKSNEEEFYWKSFWTGERQISDIIQMWSVIMYA